MGEICPVLLENGCLTGIMSSLCVQTPYSSYTANHTTGQTGSTPETPVDVKQVAHSSVPNAVLSSGIAHTTTNTNGGHTPVSCTSLDVTNEELIAREKVCGLGYPYHNLTLTLLVAYTRARLILHAFCVIHVSALVLCTTVRMRNCAGHVQKDATG